MKIEVGPEHLNGTNLLALLPEQEVEVGGFMVLYVPKAQLEAAQARIEKLEEKIGDYDLQWATSEAKLKDTLKIAQQFNNNLRARVALKEPHYTESSILKDMLEKSLK